MNANQKIVIEEIINERIRQIKKWGDNSQNLFIYNAILAEESGEVSKAILEYTFRDGKMNEIFTELIQVAAVSIAIAEDILKNLENPEEILEKRK